MAVVSFDFVKYELRYKLRVEISDKDYSFTDWAKFDAVKNTEFTQESDDSFYSFRGSSSSMTALICANY